MWVLPGTDKEAAIKVAERCRDLIAKEKLVHEKSTVSDFLTISVGVGSLIPTDEDSQIGFIESTDKLLYLAKENGRNRIEFAS